MKAAFVKSHGGTEVIEVGELPLPSVGPNDVRVKIAFAALNHLDLWIRKGWPGLKLKYPHILGSDASGIIDEVGENVHAFQVGQSVMVHPGISCGHCQFCVEDTESLCPEYKILGEQISGTNAQFITLPVSNVFPIPEQLTLEQAAAIALVFTTAWEMLTVKGRVKKGDCVLIHGAGSGVTSAAVQLAVISGAQVIVTSTSDEKLRWAQQLGAHHLINSKSEDFVGAVKKLRRSGPDLILDHVGEAFWEKNIQLLRPGGALISCGATSGNRGNTDLQRFFFRQLRLLGSTMGSKRDFPKILSLFAQGKLKPVLDRVFPLDEIANAHLHLERGHQFGKVLIRLP